MDNNQHDHGNNNNPKAPIVHEKEPMTQGELTELRAMLREARVISRVEVDQMLRFFKVSRIEDLDYAQTMISLEKRAQRLQLRLAEIRVRRTMSANDPTINLADLLF